MGSGPEVKKRAEIFAVHLFKVFKSNSQEITLEEENRLLPDNTIPITLDTSTKLFIIN